MNKVYVAPKSNLIQLGSAYEWSGVWTGPKLQFYFTPKSWIAIFIRLSLEWNIQVPG